MIIRNVLTQLYTVHTTLAKGKDDGKETGSRPSGVRRRRRGTGQGRKKQSALLVLAWRSTRWCKPSRSHITQHGVQTQRDPTTRSGYGAGTEETGGSLGVDLAKAGVVQAKKEPRNTARGPDPSEIRRRGRGTGQGRKKQAALFVLVWRRTRWRKRSRSHITQHGVQTREATRVPVN